MSLISYSKIQDGTTIDASDVNSPLDTIYNEFNGNIDSANLKDNSVTTNKLADNSVTASKMETVLYNGTPARVVALSDTYTNYSQLIISLNWMGYPHTIVHDTAYSEAKFPVTASGFISGAYKLFLGSGRIIFSGTTATGDPTSGVYCLYIGPGTPLTFADTAGEIQIKRVVGIKK